MITSETSNTIFYKYRRTNRLRCSFSFYGTCVFATCVGPTILNLYSNIFLIMKVLEKMAECSV